MTTSVWRSLFCFISLCLWFTSASYLDFPRLNFAGRFRADTSTVNNDINNFNLPKPLDGSWNPFGTGEFYLFNTMITSAVYENGTLTENDPIVNSSLVSNLLQPSAKLVDVDPAAQIKSTIYGMKLSLLNNSKVVTPSPILEGEWIRSVIAYDVWVRVLCSDSRISSTFSALATSRLKNVTWGDVSGSTVLQQLQTASLDDMLSVRITYLRFVRNNSSGNFTFGEVVGTIGISKPGESLNAAGQRLLSYQGVRPVNISVPPTDSCYNFSNESIYWTYKAPFQLLHNMNESVLMVDLSNSLAMDTYGNIRNLGRLQFAVFIEHLCCMDLIEPELDYLASGWLRRTGGIVDIRLSNEQSKRLNQTHLLLVHVQPGTNVIGSDDETYKVCELLPSQWDDAESVQVMLKEIQYFIRPTDYIVSRLQRVYAESIYFDLLVTDFGAPAKQISINVTITAPCGDPVPSKGLLPSKNIVTTNEDGIATFSLRVNDAYEERIPYPRLYKFINDKGKCDNITVSVDGQLYQYTYTVIGSDSSDICTDQMVVDMGRLMQFVMCNNPITVLVHSDPSEFNYTEPYTWVDHVQPIFEQYYRLYPVMSNILNLSNYSNVILPHNINLLRFSMNSEFDNPTYMPVTRDLSPLKQQVIIKWLDVPLYNTLGDTPPLKTPVCIPSQNTNVTVPIITFSRCPSLRDNVTIALPFSSYPSSPFYDTYYEHLAIPNQNSDQPPQQCQWQIDAMFNNCTVETLMQQVQQAIELEFATIPLYMTSLYSIVDGCNNEVYSLIRSVLMQEMLHMAQVANLLIALGGTPLIDSNDTAPSYPSLGLPGCVLPNLTLTLERASQDHIGDVFMGVEFPHETDVARRHPEFANSTTIGEFYRQMNTCISELTNKDIELFSDDHISKQVQWPWMNNTYGTLYVVNNITSAMNAIREITEQGEGASPVQPNDRRDELAHFYKFEEIVCEAYLVMINATHYSFSGDSIQFQADGVWPMRNNPSKNGIIRGTQAYFEAKAFHQVYRNLLKKLQETFGGRPELITDIISLMESVQVHAKRLMAIRLDTFNDETVGPVFDYLLDD